MMPIVVKMLLLIVLLSNILIPQTAVRGVWLTNVDSDVLLSKEKIDEAVAFCDSLGMNSIFVVVWNKGMTMFPSKVAEEFFGTKIDPVYGNRDPLLELINAAHLKKIKVFAWFEFGFASSYNENGGNILKKYPHWAAKDKNGNLAVKNNFEWMNGFHPEVQDFMLRLIAEVVTNYPVDGIQGDDRLPAMPSLAGYDDYTVTRYQKQFGSLPPTNEKDSAWVQWRSDILTDFMGRIYGTVKSIRKDVLVSMAPSIFPWSKEEYLQDWVKWMQLGYVELLCPQVYRYSISEYTSALSTIIREQVPAEQLHRFYPGVLIKVGKYYPDSQFLSEMIEANRTHGIPGEVFFFYEGLKKFPLEFRNNFYKIPVTFPELLH